MDAAWPQDDDSATEHFHQILTLNTLKSKVKQVGEKNVRELIKHFPAVLGGYELDTLLDSTEIPLFEMDEENYPESEDEGNDA